MARTTRKRSEALRTPGVARSDDELVATLLRRHQTKERLRALIPVPDTPEKRQAMWDYLNQELQNLKPPAPRRSAGRKRQTPEQRRDADAKLRHDAEAV